MHILANMTPLMTFLVKFIHGDPSGKFFPNFWRKMFLTTFPKFWLMTSFWPQKWGIFTNFHQKWPILAKLTPLMTFLVKFIHGDPPGIIFPNFWRKIFLTTFPKFWLMTSFWPQKWAIFTNFHQKWPILTKLTPLMTFLTKFMSINLTYIMFSNF